MSAVIEEVENQIAAYSEFRAQLSELRQYNAKAVFNYEDPKGNKEARSHVYKLRQTKAAVDKVRKEEKAASLEYGRRVDAEAKEIMGEIEEMIDVHAKPLEEIEQREKDRKQKHLDHIEGMREVAAQTEHQDGRPLTAEEYQQALNYLEGLTIDESWDEFVSEAAIAKDRAIATVKDRLAARQKYESEQIELERLRKEAEERAQQDRDEKIRKEAAERAQQEAETKAQLEREAAERRENELKLAAERAEREKREAEERAANAVKAAEEKARKDAEEAKRREIEEAERREANKKHRAKIDVQAIGGMVDGGLSKSDATLAISLISQGKVPNVKIQY